MHGRHNADFGLCTPGLHKTVYAHRLKCFIKKMMTACMLRRCTVLHINTFSNCFRKVPSCEKIHMPFFLASEKWQTNKTFATIVAGLEMNLLYSVSKLLFVGRLSRVKRDKYRRIRRYIAVSVTLSASTALNSDVKSSQRIYVILSPFPDQCWRCHISMTINCFL